MPPNDPVKITTTGPPRAAPTDEYEVTSGCRVTLLFDHRDVHVEEITARYNPGRGSSGHATCEFRFIWSGGEETVKDTQAIERHARKDATVDAVVTTPHSTETFGVGVRLSDITRSDHSEFILRCEAIAPWDIPNQETADKLERLFPVQG